MQPAREKSAEPGPANTASIGTVTEVPMAPVVPHCPNGHPITDGTTLCPICGTLVDTGVPVLPPPRSVLPSVPGYELLYELGRGGMGIVYKACQLRLNRIVAVKMILAGDFAPTEIRKRFQREAEAVARLQHANIVQIFEVGEADGKPFFSLEFVDGASLAQRLRGIPLASKQAAHLSQILAKAVHCAHEQGIIHRDLKPANILIGGEAAPSSAEQWTPKITDFGLAKLGNDTAHSVPGAILGTPSYMAPEQADSKRGPIGPATDVYALGAVLYELLTGRPPFVAPTAHETIAQVLHVEPVPVRRLQRQVPLDLETICLKCLQKDPARRYPSAAELAEDLARFEAKQPIHARPISSVEIVWRLCLRNPLPATLATLLLVVFLVGFGLVAWLWQEEISATKKANAETQAKQIALNKEKSALDESRKQLRLAARLAFSQGTVYCEQGDVARGSFWFVRSLELAQAVDKDLEESLRQQLASWRPLLPGLKSTWELPRGVHVRAAAFSPSGATLALACDDNWVRFYDPGTAQARGQPIKTLLPIVRLDFHPDEKSLLGWSSHKNVQLWNVETGAMSSLPAGDGGLLAIGFLDGSQLLAARRVDLQISVFDGEKDTFLDKQETPLAAVFSRDGKMLLLRFEKTVECWNWMAKKHESSLPHSNQVLAAAISPDGKTILTASGDGIAQLWDRANKEPRWTKFHLGEISAVGFSAPQSVHPNAGLLLTTNAAGQCWVWEFASHPQPLRRELDGKTIKAVAFTEDGTALRLIDSEPALWTWSLQADKPAKLLHKFPGNRNLLKVSLDASALMHSDVESKRDALEFWDVERNAKISLKQPHGVAAVVPNLLHFNDNRQHLSVVDSNGIHLFDARSGEFLRSVDIKNINALASDPEGKTILAGYGDTFGAAQLWDAASGKAVGRVLDHEKPVRSAAIARSGQRLLTGCRYDGTVHIWDAATSERVGEPLHLAKWVSVSAVAFSPNDRWVAAGGWDGTLRIWENATSKPVGPAIRFSPEILSVVFHPDPRQPTLLTLCRDGAIQLWTMPAPMPGAPQEIRSWLELTTGKEMDGNGRLKSSSSKAWQDAKAAGGAD